MIIKTDFSGVLNSDVAPQKLQPTDYVNMQNMRMGTTDKGRTGQLESIGSSLGITNPYLPAGTNLSNGKCEDEAGQRLFEFVWNSNGDHAIFCSDGAIFYKVLLNSQITGGLNFDKEHYIHSARIVGNLLIWTDNFNEQKCINVDAGIKLNHSTYVTSEAPYATPIKYTTTTLIKRPPIYPLFVGKVTDNTYPNNFIAKNAYLFRYRFRYRDNQTSKLSAYSKLIPYNSVSDTFNRIDITVPVSEYIDDDIFAIDICVTYGNVGKTFIIKSWDKDSDATAIANHNLGTALNFSFFDDISGEALDAVYSNTPFESIPLLSETLEIAKNRIYLGNNLFGYKTPSSSSLLTTLGTVDTGGGGTFVADWKYMTLPYRDVNGYAGVMTYYYAYCTLTNTTNSVFYYTAYQTSTPPTTIDISTADVACPTEAEFASYAYAFFSPPSGFYWIYYSYPPPSFYSTGGNTSLVVSGPSGSYLFFKSNSTYKVSIAFFDRYRRKCGIVKDYKKIVIPARTYNQTVFNVSVNWTLNNTNALVEIPDWAYYYQIHITKNQTYDFFEQINSPKSSYVTKSDAGVFTYNQTTWAINTNYAVSFDLTQLISNGLGYTYNEGDFLIAYKSDGTFVTLPVLGMDGNNILCHPTDLGDLTTDTSFLVEIFTPYKALETELFYETGTMYNVNSPGTSSRTYSVLSDSINGDCYYIQRTKGVSSLYVVEAMSPNDKVWMTWQTNTGWPNEVDTVGQKLIKGSIAFSDTYIEGTKVNGLSSFQPLNVESISVENGALRKLILTSKTQAEGSVMLAICEKETLSVYLGESVLMSSTGENTAIAQSSKTIGTINPLKGGYGTINPESVVEYRGEVYWFDAKAGDFIFYSVNGLNPLTKYTKRFVKLYSDQYKSLTSAEIEALGNRPLIIGGVDIYHREILWSIPKVGDNPNGVITDIGIDYPYDLLDYQGKTIVFKGEFMGSYSFNAESFVSIGNKLFYFVGGNMYLCNQTTSYNNFNGTQQKARIMFAVNTEPSTPKVLAGISVESNVCPDYVHFRSEYPDIQSSDLVSTDFTEKEGIYYASALRDRLSPNTTGTYEEKLCKGDRVRGTYIYCLIEFWTSELVQLKAVNVSFVDSIGHRV